MEPSIYRFRVAAFLVIFLPLLQACSYVKLGEVESPTVALSADELATARAEAQKLLLILNNTNDDLETFKGVGNIKLWNKKNPSIAERVAWVGARPASLSIVVLISGHSGLRLSTDGKHFYYLDVSNENHPFKKVRASEASFERILSIPIKSVDIIEFLRGRIPLYDYSSAVLISELSGNNYVLVLEKKWRGVIEKVYLDMDKKSVCKVEIFNGKGGLRYRAEFKGMQNIQGYRVPRLLEISNDKGDGFSLKIDRYLANISVSPSMFVLKPPTSNQTN
jgi:hypothetical protein